jgi:hypothetical protein
MGFGGSLTLNLHISLCTRFGVSSVSDADEPLNTYSQESSLSLGLEALLVNQIDAVPCLAPNIPSRWLGLPKSLGASYSLKYPSWYFHVLWTIL